MPESVTLVGLSALQTKLVGTLSVKATVPVKPFTAESVMVEVADCPALTGAGDNAVMVKSTKLNVAVAE